MTNLAGKTVTTESIAENPNKEEKISEIHLNLPKSKVNFSESGVLDQEEEENTTDVTKEIFLQTNNGEFNIGNIPTNEFLSWIKNVIPLVKHKIPTLKEVESIDSRINIYNQIVAYYAHLIQITKPRDSELLAPLPH